MHKNKRKLFEQARDSMSVITSKLEVLTASEHNCNRHGPLIPDYVRFILNDLFLIEKIFKNAF